MGGPRRGEGLEDGGGQGLHAGRMAVVDSPHASPDLACPVRFDAAFNLTDHHVDNEQLEAAHHLLRPFMLRRIKEEVEFTLPPKVGQVWGRLSEGWGQNAVILGTCRPGFFLPAGVVEGREGVCVRPGMAALRW